MQRQTTVEQKTPRHAVSASRLLFGGRAPSRQQLLRLLHPACNAAPPPLPGDLFYLDDAALEALVEEVLGERRDAMLGDADELFVDLDRLLAIYRRWGVSAEQ
ncbi:MAG: hypothetical protein H6707_00285 [Deltaproteobacteria bacterium]|nr:hypothetical protein [Deltaproteobacteria bacterium]